MKKVLFIAVMALGFIACKQSSKQSDEKGTNNQLTEMVKGIYEGVFIDIKDTIIRDNIDVNVFKETRLLANINLRESSDFWESKKDFVLFAMGSIAIPESDNYYFRLTNSGKIKLKLNNKDLIVNEIVHSKEINMGKTYLEKGFTIFEYEYYPAFKDPYLVLEWSKDGEEYEVIPNSSYNNLDAFTVENWSGTESNIDIETIPDNALSKLEKEEGWKLLFDGKSTTGWHTYNNPGTIGRKWKAQDGMLVFEGRERFEFFVAGRKIELGPTNKIVDGGVGIVTDEDYENFELALEWKISEAGNNGIFYTVQEGVVQESIGNYEIWNTSPEMQVMDNQKHKDGLIHKHRAGDLYDLIAADPIRAKPQGEWTKVRIIKNRGKVEHWLNGTKVLSYDVNSSAWKDMISKSKFSELAEFANPGPGKIGFQDHDNKVYYKNIKIRELN